MTKDKKTKPPNGSRKYPTHLPRFIGIAYSEVKREYFPTEAQYLTEKDALSDAIVIEKYLTKMRIKTKLYPANSKLPEKLRRDRPDMVINMVGSVKGSEYLASTIPAVLELLDISYTGAGILGESLSYNKFVIKKLLEQNGVPVPNYQLFNSHTDAIDPTLRFPLISKLNEIHGAVEITLDAVSEEEKHLRKRLEFLIATYKQSVLVEEYIVGRELVGYLFEGYKKKVYLAEKIFKKKGKYVFADFDRQWTEKENTITYRKFNDPLLKEYIKRAFEVTKMSDYGKFDVRIDSSGRYYFLDANSNPAFGPLELDTAMGRILNLYGLSFLDTLKRLLLNTIHLRNATNG